MKKKKIKIVDSNSVNSKDCYKMPTR